MLDSAKRQSVSGVPYSAMLDSAKRQSVSGVPYSAMSKRSEHFNCIAVKSLTDRRALTIALEQRPS